MPLYIGVAIDHRKKHQNLPWFGISVTIFFILSLFRYHHRNSRDRTLSLGVDAGCKCLNLAETYTDTLDHCTGFAKQLLGLASIEANTLPTNLEVEMQLRQRNYSLIGKIMIYAMHVGQLCKLTYRSTQNLHVWPGLHRCTQSVQLLLLMHQRN
jgi:hypothetical protein